MPKVADTSGLWTFADETHPVYTRPEDATHWQFGDQRFAAKDYLFEGKPDNGTGMPVSEHLSMEMLGAPSVTVYQHGGSRNTVMRVELNTRYMPQMDLSAIRPIARQWWELLREMSTGPYTGEWLRKMGNPYGYGPTPDEKRKLKRAGRPIPERSWEMLKHPRKLPAQKTYYKGLRGRVADRDIINRGKGNLYRGWMYTIALRGDGINIYFWNEAKAEGSDAPYPWFIFHGTIHMQAHGPWGVVAERLLGPLQAAWIASTREAQRATARREQAMAALVGERAAQMTDPQILEGMI